MKKIELILWFKCNCRCVFCAVDQKTAEQSMSTVEAIRYMAQSRKEGAVEVSFGGGEPTLRKDLLDLTRAATRLGYYRIGVRSNGLLFYSPEFVEKCMHAGINQFVISIKACSPAVQDELSQVEGAFEKMEMGLKHIVDFGGDIEAEILLTRETVSNLRELVKHCVDIGVRKFHMYLYSLFGSNYALPELLPTMTAAGRMIVETAQAFKREDIRIYTTHIPPCFLCPCEGLYVNMASLGLMIITPNGFFPAETSPFQAGLKTDKCTGCVKYDLCGGIRPEYIERFSDSEIRAVKANVRAR